jgi:hypothetical protein
LDGWADGEGAAGGHGGKCAMMRAVTCRVKGKCAGMRRCVRSSVESATMVHARVPRPDRQLDAMNYSKRVRSQRLYLLALSQ